LSNFLPFVVIGITTGAVYGLAGVGLVLTYKTSGILNFAYGAVAALAVFVFYWLHTERGMPWPYAAALCLFELSPLEGLVLAKHSKEGHRASKNMNDLPTGRDDR
jgi:branched-subunit amino acid ABC-type transport system permease component